VGLSFQSEHPVNKGPIPVAAVQAPELRAKLSSQHHDKALAFGRSGLIFSALS
jgi:hypothetical protein